MKPVRVGSALYYLGPLACPRCGAPDRRGLASHGILRLSCDGSRQHHGKRCGGSWTAVRLPPGSTGKQLIDVIGPVAARVVLNAIRAENPLCRDMDEEAIVLPGGAQEAIYVQRAPDTPEPLMGWQKAQQIMNALMGTDEQQGAA